MIELPRIEIERNPENDLIVVLNALLSTRHAAQIVSDPAAFYAAYRPELRLLLDLLRNGSEPAETSEGPAPQVEIELLQDGPILR